MGECTSKSTNEASKEKKRISNFKYYHSLRGKSAYRRYRQSEKGRRIMNILNQRWRKNNPLTYRKSHEKWRAQLIKEVFEHYGGVPPKCICCGETIFEFLTIDHLKGGGTKHRKELKRNGDHFYLWLRQNNFPLGFQVLCYNCNCGRARTLNKTCPHKLNRSES